LGESHFHVLLETLIERLHKIISGVEIAANLESSERAVNAPGQILGHNARFDRVNAGPFNSLCKTTQIVIAIQFSAMVQAPSPRKDGRNRVGRGFVAFLMLAIVTRDGAMGCLCLDCLNECLLSTAIDTVVVVADLAIGRHQHRRHETERAKALGECVRLDIAIVILACPHESAV
jgi:hypothetical protein